MLVLADFVMIANAASGQESATGRWTVEERESGPDVVAVSEYVAAIALKPDDYPRARVVVACDSVWIQFTSSPNPNTTELSKPLARRIDDSWEMNAVRLYYRVTHPESSRELQFGRNQKLVSELASGSSFGIVVPWRRQRDPLYSWSLRGSSIAIRGSCRK